MSTKTWDKKTKLNSAMPLSVTHRIDCHDSQRLRRSCHRCSGQEVKIACRLYFLAANVVFDTIEQQIGPGCHGPWFVCVWRVCVVPTDPSRITHHAS